MYRSYDEKKEDIDLSGCKNIQVNLEVRRKAILFTYRF